MPANHMDNDPISIKQSNYMTNVLPQAASMNRGAWLLTEEITECYRDISPVRVMGGVIWGDNADDDHFITSHGVATPDAFWKVIIINDAVIAWIVPNSKTAKRKLLDSYIVPVSDIESLIGETLGVTAGATPLKSWPLPRGCDKS